MFIKGQSSQFVLSFAYFYLLLSMQLNVDQRIVIFDLTSILLKRKNYPYTRRQNFSLVQIQNICRHVKCWSKHSIGLSWGRNIMEKGENAGDQHFLLFLTMFSKGIFLRGVKSLFSVDIANNRIFYF